MLDLDFTDEQDMLREMVRGVIGQHASLDVVRAMEDDPVGYPAELWSQFAELGLLGLLLPERARRLGHVDARRRHRLRGARPVARARCRTSSAACCRPARWSPAGSADAAGRVAARSSSSGEAILTAGLARARERLRPEGRRRCAPTPDGDGFTITRHEAARVRSRLGRSALVVLARTGDGEATSTCSSSTPPPPASRSTQQMSISSDTQYRVDLDGVRGDRRRSHRRRRHRLGHLADGDGGRHDPRRGAGHRRRRARARDHRAVLEGPRAVRQAARRVPGAGALHGRRQDRRRRVASCSNYEAAWAHSIGHPVDQAGADVEAVRRATRTATPRRWPSRSSAASGFTLEYEIQLYFRRAKQLQISWNDTRRCEDLVAAAVLDEPPPNSLESAPLPRSVLRGPRILRDLAAERAGRPRFRAVGRRGRSRGVAPRPSHRVGGTTARTGQQRPAPSDRCVARHHRTPGTRRPTGFASPIVSYAGRAWAQATRSRCSWPRSTPAATRRSRTYRAADGGGCPAAACVPCTSSRRERAPLPTELAVVHRVRALPPSWVTRLRVCRSCVPSSWRCISSPVPGRNAPVALTDRLWSMRLLSGPSSPPSCRSWACCP